MTVTELKARLAKLEETNGTKDEFFGFVNDFSDEIKWLKKEIERIENAVTITEKQKETIELYLNCVNAKMNGANEKDEYVASGYESGMLMVLDILGISWDFYPLDGKFTVKERGETA